MSRHAGFLALCVACAWIAAVGAVPHANHTSEQHEFIKASEEESGQLEFSPANPFLFWTDYPGSQPYIKTQPQWYDPISTAAGQSFPTTSGASVNVNWAAQGALHLWADPSFQQQYDSLIREASGKDAGMMTGSVDSCGWPLESPQKTPAAQQYTKRTTPFHDDFTNGLLETNFLIPTGYKMCCTTNLSDTFSLVPDVVNGVTKPVLAFKAYNGDSGACDDPASAACRKIVTSAGGLITADIYGSGVYTVVAKVPQAPGMVWAIWTYHYELHMPQDCSRYTCYCGTWGKQGCPKPGCMPSNLYPNECPAPNGCQYATYCADPGYAGSVEQKCGRNHTIEDPQFYGAASFTDFLQQTNHEIDIEIPANCMNTPNVCNNAQGSCEGDYSTANFNNYLLTNQNGGGPAYSNMCGRVATSSGKPMQLLGDGQYHNYTIEWHTGTSSAGGPSTDAYVNYFIDGVYMGTNNAFVPTRAGRLWIFLWPNAGAWNGYPDNWGNGHPGDGKVYSQVTHISSVTITPFNEPNDIAYPMTIDRPDGCESYVGQQECHRWTKFSIKPLEQN